MEIQELKDQIEKKQLKVDEQNNKLLEQQLKDLIKQITSVDYENIDSILFNSFLFGKLKHIIKHLKTKYQMDNYFEEIPSFESVQKNNSYSLTVTGVKAHHDEFKLVLKRIQTLSNITKSAKIIISNN